MLLTELYPDDPAPLKMRIRLHPAEDPSAQTWPKDDIQREKRHRTASFVWSVQICHGARNDCRADAAC